MGTMLRWRFGYMLVIMVLIGLQCGIAPAGELDVQTLKDRLAAQEARLNELQTKLGGGSTSAYPFAVGSGGGTGPGMREAEMIPENILSIEKNAAVTVGGFLNTRYFFRQGKAEGRNGTLLENPTTGAVDQNEIKAKYGDFRIDDAKISLKIDVNDHFDAFLQMDLQDGDFDRAGVAEKYWIRWKNIANSGFGILVGRNDLVFGDGGHGVITGWTGGNGSFGDLPAGLNHQRARLGWDHKRTTQLTPYWESRDSKFKAEASLFQSIDAMDGNATLVGQTTTDGEFRYRAINYGVGSAALRLTASPLDGLHLTAGIINIRHDPKGEWQYLGPKANSPFANPEGGIFDGVSNSTAMNLAFRNKPCFLPRLTTWAQWVWNFRNAGWDDGYKTHAVNAGFSLDISDRFGWFLQGDFLSGRDKDDGDYREKGYAAYTGFTYTLPHGINAEIGYRYERIKFKWDGAERIRQTANTAYAHLGFVF